MLANALQRNGYAVVDAVLSADECNAVIAQIASGDGPGSRDMLAMPWCAQLARQLHASQALAALLPMDHVAVQCTYFEKSRNTNWLVPIHQDQSIPVRERKEHAELSGWSSKEGACFVQPPQHVLEQLLAVRLHLDECGPDDGPLRVVHGSHTQGIIDADQAREIRAAQGDVACPAHAGAALLMRPLLLHASSKANGSSRRRVLHFLFGPAQLPYGLQWALAV